jgi:multiple sugar transport system permease protein
MVQALERKVIVNRKRKSPKQIAFDILAYFVMIFFAVLVLVPFLIALITSLTPESVLTEKGFQFFSGYIDFGYYTDILTTNDYGDGSFLQALGNTFYYIFPPVVFGLLNSALAGYAFARINFRGRKIAFYLILSTMVIPGIIVTFPSYLLFIQVYKVNDWFPLFPILIPGAFGGVITTFFLKQYFSTLPYELEEAAAIDGAGRIKTFFRIIVPVSSPALITQLLLGFNGCYNDYLGPLLYLGGKPSLYTVQLYVCGLSTAYNKSYPLLMAGSILALLPVLILYIFGQKFFVQGIVMTGIKG